MGKRRKIASLRDQDRHETVKLVNATTGCIFFCWLMAAPLKKIGGIISKGGRPSNQLEFVMKPRLCDIMFWPEPGSVHGNRLLSRVNYPSTRAATTRCSSPTTALRLQSTPQVFDALTPQNFDFLLAQLDLDVLPRLRFFDVIGRYCSSRTPHYWTSMLLGYHPICSMASDVLLYGDRPVARFTLSKRRLWKEETSAREVFHYEDEDGRQTFLEKGGW
nr:unnamed protein product [Haemonchus contortus]